MKYLKFYGLALMVSLITFFVIFSFSTNIIGVIASLALGWVIVGFSLWTAEKFYDRPN